MDLTSTHDSSKDLCCHRENFHSLYVFLWHRCRAIQEEVTHHQVLRTAVDPMAITPQLRTEARLVLQVLTVVMEASLRLGSMGLDQEEPLGGPMEATVDSLMEDSTDTTLPQVNSCVKQEAPYTLGLPSPSSQLLSLHPFLSPALTLWWDDG